MSSDPELHPVPRTAVPPPGTAAEMGATLRVVKGHATGEELAALAAVLAMVTARGQAAAESARRHEAARGSKRAGAWADRAHLVRAPLAHGAGAWRRSALPR
jgi:Acyl-CoA carboxylase epsilon subunit